MTDVSCRSHKYSGILSEIEIPLIYCAFDTGQYPMVILFDNGR
jgi:hypothetical protein